MVPARCFPKRQTSRMSPVKAFLRPRIDRAALETFLRTAVVVKFEPLLQFAICMQL
jgi:hypothetical protein